MIRPKRAPEWEKQLRYDIQFAERRLIANGSVRRMFMVHLERAIHILTPRFEDKDTEVAYLGAYCTAHDARAISSIAEAWMRIPDKRHGETDADYNRRLSGVAPSEDETRIEIVVAVVAYRDSAGERQTISEIREIERRSNGKPSGLVANAKFERIKPETTMGGRFAELLPPRPPTARERMEAVALLRSLGTVDTMIVPC